MVHAYCGDSIIHMLSDPIFVEFISNQIDFFISTNSSHKISASLFWEALKAFLRGGIVSYTSHKVRLYKKGYSEITQKITELDNICAVTRSSDIHKECQLLQAEFDILSASYMENILLRTRSRYYEESDKAGRVLALQLRQETSSLKHLQAQHRSHIN